MKKSLELIFSEENLLDYGRACLEVALDLSGRDFDTLLIPSRGAFPIFLGAISAIKFLKEDYGDFKDLYNKLNPVIDVNGILEEYLKGSKKDKEHPINILFSPFTADLNIRDKNVDNTKMTEFVRDYWAKVTAAFFSQNDKRMENHYFRSFTDIILRFMEKREDLAVKYENFPIAKDLVLIDTVISGRASSTILDCFDKIGIKPYSILVVDENGSKLKVPFKQKLMRRVYNESAKLISTNRIVSEDEGACLEGVVALIYPTIMIDSFRLKHNEEDFFIGAGSWHYPPLSDSIYSDNFRLFMNTIRDAVEVNVSRGYCEKREGRNPEEIFLKSRRIFLENMEKYNFMGIKDNSVTSFNLNHSLNVISPYETGSHVLHVPFDETSNESIFQEILSKIPNTKLY
ncbi:MAG: hypothetical protein AABW83_02315 [Nanoarchaeota archaeon]